MTDQEMIDAALQAIGVGAKGDYKIQPTVHAAELVSKAPTLAAILNKAQFSVLAEEYERKDQGAGGVQEHCPSSQLGSILHNALQRSTPARLSDGHRRQDSG